MECVGVAASKRSSEFTAPTAEWTVEAVCEWAGAAGLSGPCVARLRSERIDGAALLELSETDMQEHLTFPLGTRKLLVRERAKLLRAPPPRAVDGNSEAADDDDDRKAADDDDDLPDIEFRPEDTCAERCCHQAKPMRNVFFWYDTAFPKVFKSPELYLAVLLSVISVAVRASFEDDAVAPTWEGGPRLEATVAPLSETLSLLHWAMVFYMGFYNSQVYKRWDTNWYLTQVALGRINDLNVLVPSYMSESPKLAADVLRFVNAFHHLQYFDTHGLPVEYALQVCITRRLLTQKEVADLRSQSCSKGLRVLVWTSQTVLSSGINPMLTSQINDRILGLRSSFAAIWSFNDQLLPFAYPHAMKFFILLVILWKSSLSGFQGSGVLNDDSRIDWVRTVLIVSSNSLWAFAILMLREVPHIIADPWSSSKNGVNSEYYLDFSVAYTSKLVKHNAARRDASQDPSFATMADVDAKLWEFKQRERRDVRYLRYDRYSGLRLACPDSLGVPWVAGDAVTT